MSSDTGLALVSELSPGSYACVSTRTLFGWLVRMGTRSPVDHAFIVLGGGLICEATARGVRIDLIDRYRNQRICANTAEVMTAEQRKVVCDRARSYAGREYGWSDIALIALRRIGLRGNWLRQVLSDRDALICSELVSDCGEAAYLDWLCGTGSAELVTPALLAQRPAVRPVAWD